MLTCAQLIDQLAEMVAFLVDLFPLRFDEVLVGVECEIVGIGD